MSLEMTLEDSMIGSLNSHQVPKILVTRESFGSDRKRDILVKMEHWNSDIRDRFTNSVKDLHPFHRFFSDLISCQLESSQGNSEFGSFIALVGEPSTGKTTELQRITQDLSKDEYFRESAFPIYCELQRSNPLGKDGDGQVWKSIINGSFNIDFVYSEYSESLVKYRDKAIELNRKPILFIDTLDILLLDELHPDSPISVVDVWKSFMEECRKLGIFIVWTTRPVEWNSFEERFDENLKKMILKIPITELIEKEIKPFPDLKLESDNRLNELWKKWSISIQCSVPLFASKWTCLDEGSRQRLSDGIINKFQEMFCGLMGEQISENSSWEKLLSKIPLPTALLYEDMQSLIISTSEKIIENVNKKDVEIFMHILEQKIVDFTLKGQRNQSNRLRFSTNLVWEEIAVSPKCSVERKNIGQIFNICEAIGLFVRKGPWLEFSHQLLFEETLEGSFELLTSSERKKLLSFPSIMLRHIKEVKEVSDTKQMKTIHEGMMNSSRQWYGYILAFHLDIINPTNKLEMNESWKSWLERARRNVESSSESDFKELDFDEGSEKLKIWKEFIRPQTPHSLVLRGGPGTGKTYFAELFLLNSLVRSSKTGLTWRYITMNPHLVEDFDSHWQVRGNDHSHSLYGKESENSGSFSVSQIFSEICELPIQSNLRIGENPNFNRMGIFTFPHFRRKIEEYYLESTDYTRKSKIPPVEEAWRVYCSIIHDDVTGRPIPEKEVKKIADWSSKKKESFLKFSEEMKNKGWLTNSSAAYLAREKLNKMSDDELALRTQDILIVDEIQDIEPSVLALLVMLMSRGFDKKSILLTGDEVQTVNRMVFNWDSLFRKTMKCLLKNPAPSAITDSLTKVFPDYEDIQLLKRGYRNAPNISEYNNEMRTQFKKLYPKLTDSLPGYGYGELEQDETASAKNEFCKITNIVVDSDDDLEAVIKKLSQIEDKVSLTSRTSVLTAFNDPYYRTLLEPFSLFTNYDAESVKGLEFGGVIVIQPYEMRAKEIGSVISKNMDSGTIESRIKKWTSIDTPANQKALELFTPMFSNLLTRMNVIYSRPAYRLMIISRTSIGKSQELTHNTKNEDIKYFTFQIPEIPENVGVIQITGVPSEDQLIEALQMPEGEAEVDLKSSFKWAIETSLNNIDGSQDENERKMWKNLFKVAVAKNGYSSICYPAQIPWRTISLIAGGYAGFQEDGEDEKVLMIPILERLRPGLSEDGFKYNSSGDYLYLDSTEKEDGEYVILESFIRLLTIAAIQQERFDGRIEPEVYWRMLTKIRGFLEILLKEPVSIVDDEQFKLLLNLLVNRILGLNSRIKRRKNEIIIVDEVFTITDDGVVNLQVPDWESVVKRISDKGISLDSKNRTVDEILQFMIANVRKYVLLRTNFEESEKKEETITFNNKDDEQIGNIPAEFAKESGFSIGSDYFNGKNSLFWKDGVKCLQEKGIHKVWIPGTDKKQQLSIDDERIARKDWEGFIDTLFLDKKTNGFREYLIYELKNEKRLMAMEPSKSSIPIDTLAMGWLKIFIDQIHNSELKSTIELMEIYHYLYLNTNLYADQDKYLRMLYNVAYDFSTVNPISNIFESHPFGEMFEYSSTLFEDEKEIEGRSDWTEETFPDLSPILMHLNQLFKNDKERWKIAFDTFSRHFFNNIFNKLYHTKHETKKTKELVKRFTGGGRLLSLLSFSGMMELYFQPLSKDSNKEERRTEHKGRSKAICALLNIDFRGGKDTGSALNLAQKIHSSIELENCKPYYRRILIDYYELIPLNQRKCNVCNLRNLSTPAVNGTRKCLSAECQTGKSSKTRSDMAHMMDFSRSSTIVWDHLKHLDKNVHAAAGRAVTMLENQLKHDGIVAIEQSISKHVEQSARKDTAWLEIRKSFRVSNYFVGLFQAHSEEEWGRRGAIIDSVILSLISDLEKLHSNKLDKKYRTSAGFEERITRKLVDLFVKLEATVGGRIKDSKLKGENSAVRNIISGYFREEKGRGGTYFDSLIFYILHRQAVAKPMREKGEEKVIFNYDYPLEFNKYLEQLSLLMERRHKIQLEIYKTPLNELSFKILLGDSYKEFCKLLSTILQPHKIMDFFFDTTGNGPMKRRKANSVLYSTNEETFEEIECNTPKEYELYRIKVCNYLISQLLENLNLKLTKKIEWVKGMTGPDCFEALDKPLALVNNENPFK